MQGAGDLDRVGERLGDLEPLEAADPLLERLAGDVLKDDERRTAILADVDHLHDVRVVELRDGARLAAEALELLGVAGDRPQHQFDRDAALEHDVERPVDVRHPARTDLRIEAVTVGENRRAGSRHPAILARSAAQRHHPLQRRRSQGVYAASATER